VISSFGAFLAVSVAVIVTPGQDTALTIRNALAGGRRAGVRTAAGVAVGQATWTLAASAGVAAVLRASEPAFLAIRLLGAAYLVYLGLQTLLRRGAPLHAGGPSRRAFRQGLLSNLGNPKMAVFFTSLLPQFADSFAGLAALGLVFCSLTFLWLSAYGAAVAKAGDVLRRPAIRRALDWITGVALVALGFRLALDDH
jgi:threonine/homoserine/homoserine lactone efflux protein